MPYKIVVKAAGGVDQLARIDMDMPVPAKGEIVIRQTAVGLNFIDIYQRTGLYPVGPNFVPGGEAAGVIEAVGPGARDEAGKLVPLDVKAGDRVLFGKWSGTEVKLDGEELLIIKESDIMGVIEPVAQARKAA